MCLPSHYDDLRLLVRNFPEDFTESEISEFVSIFDPSEIEIQIDSRTANLKFPNAEHAKDALSLIHQAHLNGRLLLAEYAKKNGSTQYMQYRSENERHPCNNCSSINSNFNETIKRIYSTCEQLDFGQPAPPYLKYEYPLVNRDIIDSICIALESSPKFYTQVLHLMNRMNLEPPFVPGAEGLTYERTSMEHFIKTNVSTQTDELVWEQIVKHKRKFLASDESEMETESSGVSEGETAEILALRKNKGKLKRKRKNTEDVSDLKEKVRKRFKITEKTLIDKKYSTNINEIFDIKRKEAKSGSIHIVPPANLPVEAEETHLLGPVPEVIEVERLMPQAIDAFKEQNSSAVPGTLKIMTQAELNENRIPAEQLKTHPLFLSYNPGVPSNKLYIKNIAKEVTLDDLKAVYNRYLDENSGEMGNVQTIDIRLMTTGRMKGQAFVTFSGPYMDIEDNSDTSNNDAAKFHMIQRALDETNGLILKTKVLVVMFGKNK